MSNQVEKISTMNGARQAPAERASSVPSWRVLLGSRTAVTCISSALAFTMLGATTLLHAHPEEDAYIMFRYAEHLAHGKGIVFNAAGPRAEGATDFLWLLLLAAFRSAGLDIALASVLLNAAGAALATFVLLRAFGTGAADSPRLTSVVVAACVLLSSAATAAYVGFGSMIYAGMALAALHVSITGSRSAVGWLPGLALLLGLFRPDGVVLGASAAMVGALRARELGVTRRYLARVAWAVACGLAYYAWRWWYFGLALPLPLYVKSRVEVIEKLAALPVAAQAVARRLPGLGADVHWLLVGGAGAATVVGLATLLLLWRAERSVPRLLRRLVGAWPALALLGSLAFAHQTQNIGWRFQAPVQLAALYLAFRGVRAVLARGLASNNAGALMVAASAICLGIPGVLNLVCDLNPARGGYLNAFAARYAGSLPSGTRIALTEAGRLPFWSHAEVLDVVGLNSPQTALRPVTREMLSAFAPQMLFFHTSETLDTSSLRGAGRVARIAAIRPLVFDRFRTAFDRDFGSYSEFPFSSIRLTTLVMAHYLADNSDRYEVFAVDLDGDGGYPHILALRKDMDVDRALGELRSALQPGTRPSYSTLARERRQ